VTVNSEMEIIGTHWKQNGCFVSNCFHCCPPNSTLVLKSGSGRFDVYNWNDSGRSELGSDIPIFFGLVRPDQLAVGLKYLAGCGMAHLQHQRGRILMKGQMVGGKGMAKAVVRQVRRLMKVLSASRSA